MLQRLKLNSVLLRPWRSAVCRCSWNCWSLLLPRGKRSVRTSAISFRMCMHRLVARRPSLSLVGNTVSVFFACIWEGLFDTHRYLTLLGYIKIPSNTTKYIWGNTYPTFGGNRTQAPLKEGSPTPLHYPLTAPRSFPPSNAALYTGPGGTGGT